MVTIIATILLIAGIVLLIIFDPFSKPDTNTPDDTVVEDTTITLMDKSNKNTVVVQKVDIENQSGKYSILYNDDEGIFYIDGYDDILLSTDMSNLLQEYTSKLIAIDKVEDNNNLKDFGLDKPTSTVTITFTDKSVTTIQVGNVTPDVTPRSPSRTAKRHLWILR